MRQETADQAREAGGLEASGAGNLLGSRLADAKKYLERRQFGILMTGSSISMLGSRISTVAFPMLVLNMSGSPLMAGVVSFAGIVPAMFAYIPAGVLVDRWDQWKVMLFSELLRGITIACVFALLFFEGRPSMALLIFAMIAEEILEVFSVLADRSYLSRLVENDKISSAQGYMEVRAHAVVVAGRPIGPFLFQLSHGLPFLADAISFACSVGGLSLLRNNRVPLEPPPDESRRRDFKGEFVAGLRRLISDKHAGITVMLMAGTTLIAQALIMLFLAEAHNRDLSSLPIGVVLAASGVGGALGSIFAKRLPGLARSYWLQIQLGIWSFAIFALALFGGSVAGMAAAMIVLSCTGAIGNIEFGAYLVKTVPNWMLARVTSIGQALTIFNCPGYGVWRVPPS